jgi:hypothetical protein
MSLYLPFTLSTKETLSSESMVDREERVFFQIREKRRVDGKD